MFVPKKGQTSGCNHGLVFVQDKRWNSGYINVLLGRLLQKYSCTVCGMGSIHVLLRKSAWEYSFLMEPLAVNKVKAERLAMAWAWNRC